MHADEDGNQVKNNPEHHGNNLHEEGTDNVQLNPENHGNHLHVEEGEDQVNPECHDHFQGGDQI